MSSTPQETGTDTSQPPSGPSVDEEVETDGPADDLQEHLTLVATKSPL